MKSLVPLLLLSACSGPSALYGVNVNLGSALDQLSNSPPSYTAVVVIGHAGVGCPERKTVTENVFGAAMRDQGVDFVRFTAPLVLSGSEPISGFSYDASSKSERSVSASLSVSVANVQNLPARKDATFASLGFPDVNGTFAGMISGGTSWLHNQHFSASHCPAFDSVVGE